MQRETVLLIGGMSCQACANRIEKVLNKQDFVLSASVSFAGEMATVLFDETLADEAALVAAVERAGFTAVVRAAAAPVQETAWPWRECALLLLCLPFMWGMVGMMLGRHDWMVSPLWQLLLASVVQWGLMWPFYRGAWAALRSGTANMDVLVSLGTLAAYALSLANVWQGGAAAHALYFEASVMVAAFVSLGKYGEKRLKRGGLNSLATLVALTPAKVARQQDGAWVDVPLADVAVGDVLRVDDGERVAADGVVLAGAAWVDERHLTGEGRLLSRAVGERVAAGALVSGGSLTYRAAALGADTLLGDMMQALAQAQASKAPMARLADRVSAVFVPVVVVVALLTGWVVYATSGGLEAALVRAVAVLVISCPCALGLAAPAAVMAGIGVAARAGIRFKDAAALEAAAGCTVLAFDKTGTLTRGEARLAGVWVADGVSEADLWRAAAVAQYSSHPLSQAVWQAAQQRGVAAVALSDVAAQVGQGVSARWMDGVDGAAFGCESFDAKGASGGLLRLGKADFCGFRPPEAVWAAQPQASWVAASLDGRPLGAWAWHDALHDDAPRALARLREMGVRVAVLSGDRQAAVEAVVPEGACFVVRGACSARDKVDAVRAWQAAGEKVAMVGDGVNDAAALAAADAGLAMGHGMQAAEHAASAVLLRNSPMQAVAALQVARATVGNIKQNLFFSFFYNALGIPLAAAGYLTPVVAGAAMALSSLSVLFNAWRLTRWQAED